MQKQIKHMDALIQKDAAARKFGVRAPCIKIGLVHGFTVAPAHPEHGQDLARGFLNRADFFHFSGIERRWLFAKHMLAGL